MAEETKRIKLQKKTEEVEQKRLATEFNERKHQHILREIEEREREEAQELFNDVGKRIKKKGKKPIIEGVTEQSLMELVMQEQVRERQEMEKRIQKLIKTMDHFERAKREEAAPLIEAESVMKEKYRLSRVMEHKTEKERLNLAAHKCEEEEARKREEVKGARKRRLNGGLSCIGLVKLIGRNSGFTFIAMHATLASPEKRIKENEHMVIVVAAAAGQEFVAESLRATNKKDAYENKLLDDISL
uniref:Uncharacterized protein n=1 Tax=Lactuca sativa TaxID=4236 RepID=A0A9R1XA63_LACSA|nr:hypothetical protein LSAT_V11C500267100 [Lactuca sativa]